MRRIGRSTGGRRTVNRVRTGSNKRSRLTRRRRTTGTKGTQRTNKTSVDQNKKTAQSAQSTGAKKPDDKKKTESTFFNRLGGIINSKFNTKPNADQRKALETMSKMLGPDKLGGKDSVFNHQDQDAIVKGLLQDRNGMVKEASTQLRKEGKNFQANLVERAFSGRSNRIKQKIKNRVKGEVTDQVKNQLNRGLDDAKVDRKQGGPLDQSPRTISFQELRTFEAASKVAQEYQKEVSQRLGFDIVFPKGISQAAIQHTLDGKFGIPPGGVIKPR